MNLKLRVFTADTKDYSDLGRRFRFTVVDLEKSSDYPANFVCLLPTIVSNDANNVFCRIFGDRSVGQAILLLTKALKYEDKPEIKAEIKRRLKLLEPKNMMAKPTTFMKYKK
jgi:hypothetical protein